MKAMIRRYKNGYREPILLFPEWSGGDNPDLVMSYQHMGQHGAASLAVMHRTTRPEYDDGGGLDDVGALLDEYREKLDDGEALEIVRRDTPAMREFRQKQARQKAQLHSWGVLAR